MNEQQMNALAQAVAQATVAALAAHLVPAEPAKVTPPAKPAKRKAPAKPVTREVRSASHTFTGERVGTGSRKLTKGNRKAFIAAHAWAKPGFSTAAIRSEVAAGAKVNKGWNVAI